MHRRGVPDDGTSKVDWNLAERPWRTSGCPVATGTCLCHLAFLLLARAPADIPAYRKHDDPALSAKMSDDEMTLSNYTAAIAFRCLI